jgi:cytochrome P450
MAALFPEMPIEPDVTDIGPLIAEYRPQAPLGDQLFTLDPPEHSAQRALLMRLLTPKRLKENEDFMWALADRQIDEFIGTGNVEVLKDFARPFTVLVIADLLGVPEEDRPTIQTHLSNIVPRLDDEERNRAEYHNPFSRIEDLFIAYVEDRRRNPQNDVLGQLALARYPDGSVPSAGVVARMASFLFAAGGDTTSRLLLSAMRLIAEHPDLQRQLREQRGDIPDFIEETLRFESVVKTDFRLTKRPTNLGGVAMPPGTTVMLLNGAANRDPSHFDDPGLFRLDRPNVLHHVSFGRGAHACPGAPLARVEARVSVERLLDRLGEIRLSETHHGPPDDRRFAWEHTFVLRGLEELHIEFTGP